MFSRLLSYKGIICVGDTTFHVPQLPPGIISIQKAGGLLSYVQDMLKKKK